MITLHLQSHCTCSGHTVSAVTWRLRWSHCTCSHTASAVTLYLWSHRICGHIVSVVTPHLQSQSREEQMLMLGLLSSLIQSGTLAHGTLPHTYGVRPSTSISPIQKLLHRPTQSFLSSVVLEPVKITTNTKRSRACKITEQGALATVASLPFMLWFLLRWKATSILCSSLAQYLCS